MVDAAHLHPKNTRGFELLAEVAHAEVARSSSPHLWKEAWDVVWVPRGFHQSTCFPNAKRILYGPQNFVLPEPPWTSPQPPFERSVYTSLSPWVAELYAEVGTLPMPVLPIPFPVDVAQWTPTYGPKSLDCFIYYKRRDPALFNQVCAVLSRLGLTFTILVYGQYNEQTYRDVLTRAQFGVWIGTHESQGFAVQEALAMDVPLVVWNVTSMHDEYSYGKYEYAHLKERYRLEATTTTYWDATCGLVGTTQDEVETHIVHMASHAASYHPRAFVEATLSPKACWERLQAAYTT